MEIRRLSRDMAKERKEIINYNQHFNVKIRNLLNIFRLIENANISDRYTSVFKMQNII